MGWKRFACLFALIATAVLSRPLGWRPNAEASISSGEALILPQMFNLPNGGSVAVLQNLSTTQQSISVEFFDQDGQFQDFISRDVAPMGEAQVATPTGPGGQFVGSAIIRASQSFAARGQWNFNVGGSAFAVGVPSLNSNDASTTFQIPVGTVAAGSLIGVAINNPQPDSINCTAAYRNAAGNPAGEDAYSLPGFGQISEFASGVGGGFEGSATITCTGPAAAVAVIQEQINGFPTPLFACPVP